MGCSKKITLILFLIAQVYCDLNCHWPYGRIHCFGDSHCAHFFTNCSTFQEYVSLSRNFKFNSRGSEFQYEKSNFIYKTDHCVMEVPFGIHWLGPRTMHRVGRDGIDVYAYDVNPEDILVFIFGEIDVRVHIGKQIYTANRQLDEVIEVLAENYIKAIHQNQMRYDCKCFIMGIIPPNLPDHILDANDQLYLASVPLSERVVFTQKLNQKLSEKCEKSSIIFFSLPTIFSNANGSLDISYSDGGVHIHPRSNYLIKNSLVSYLIKIIS